MDQISENTRKARFQALVSRNAAESVSHKELEKLWKDIVEHYSQDHKLYHSIQHVYFCLDQFDLCRNQLVNPDWVELAMWYHDIILYPEKKDNEVNSKDYFLALYSMIFPEDIRSAVAQMILVTDHRTVPATSDEAYVCDIDMSSFGIEWPLFLKDCEDLYREEKETDKVVYAEKKTRFFRYMAGKQQFFKTEHFRELYELPAKENIKRFLRMLENTPPEDLFKPG